MITLAGTSLNVASYALNPMHDDDKMGESNGNNDK